MSLVMCPHANDLDDVLLRKNLVHESMLDVYPARIGTGQISDELLVWRRCLKRIDFENLEESFGFGFQSS